MGAPPRSPRAERERDLARAALALLTEMGSAGVCLRLPDDGELWLVAGTAGAVRSLAPEPRKAG